MPMVVALVQPLFTTTGGKLQPGTPSSELMQKARSKPLPKKMSERLYGPVATVPESVWKPVLSAEGDWVLAEWSAQRQRLLTLAPLVAPAISSQRQVPAGTETFRP